MPTTIWVSLEGVAVSIDMSVRSKDRVATMPNAEEKIESMMAVRSGGEMVGLELIAVRRESKSLGLSEEAEICSRA